MRLEPDTHTLSGQEIVTYTNRTPDSIDALVFHLYLNAFRNEDTLFMREAAGAHRGFAFDPEHPGSVDVRRLTWQDVDLMPRTVIRETLMTTTLPFLLKPGETLTLEAEFEARLPRVFARTGFADRFHMVGQWFPKLGVYEAGRGWSAHPFHANSEFYADFGVYDVAITVPETYRVGATGLEVGREANGDGTVTYRFHAEAVIDFAWTAWPEFQEARRQVGSTEVVLLYAPNHAVYVERYLDVAERALQAYGAWFGPYPYPRLTIVDVPEAAGGAGGMEYPMLVTTGPPTPFPASLLGDSFPEMVTAHEIAHQWWQS
ncbi:MAG: M1 family metallopeptidase, partial [Bryobacteraceae bacterium]